MQDDENIFIENLDKCVAINNIYIRNMFFFAWCVIFVLLSLSYIYVVYVHVYMYTYYNFLK